VPLSTFGGMLLKAAINCVGFREVGMSDQQNEG